MKKIVIYLILLILVSCQKRDELPPLVIVNSPLAMSNYSVLDYIEIEGSVTDDRSIEWVQIQLLNSSLNSVAEEIVINTNELEINFSETLHIDDVHLSSGKYYIKVSASDGTNEVSKFIEINISNQDDFFLLLKTLNRMDFNLYNNFPKLNVT